MVKGEIMFTEAIHELVENAIAANPNAGKEYPGEDGLLHCGVCGEPIQQVVEELKNFLPGGIAPTQCRCMREKFRLAREEREREKARERISELQRIGFADPAYMRHTFDKDNGSSPKARAAAEWYVENYRQLRTEGKGLMFMGGTGTGKTFYACCIANALIHKGIPVWVTTMQPLLRKAGDYSAADDIFRQIQTIDLMVLDDFGTSQNSPRNLDLMFEIIDARARSGLPLIITTNLCPEDFKNAPLELQRIYSRIKELCCSCEKSPVVMTGADLREQRAREAHGG